MKNDVQVKIASYFFWIGIICLLVATFADETISRLIANQNSIFGNIFQNYAVTGAQIVTFMCVETLAWCFWKRNSETKIKWLVSGGLLAFAFNQVLSTLQNMLYYTFSMIENIKKGAPMGQASNSGATANYPETLRWTLAITLMIIFSYLSYEWIMKKDNEQIDYLFKVSLVGILVVMIATTTVDDLKTLWGRFRPYEVGVIGDQHGKFTEWFLPNGNNGHNSFPSGHTMSGWLFLYLTFFVDRQNISLQKKMTIFGLAMGILTAISRVRIGAHWLSDVTVSALIVGLLVFGASYLLNARFVEKHD
ncbi:phosphatase PAP2 family protein [Liquorilactobacillus sicerae]|uniref:phosphatase PAP2 family protein n=1 Tax=Liquorilactobacillus sicerae TaxID=1416943 RepID=UPI0024805F4B|nr:phosphatase PAP2 family protein [Liquorilactobacillus sicerae]